MKDPRLNREEQAEDRRINPDPYEYQEEAWRRERAKKKRRETMKKRREAIDIQRALEQTEHFSVKDHCIYSGDKELCNFFLRIKEQIVTRNSGGKPTKCYVVSGKNVYGDILEEQIITSRELRNTPDILLDIYAADLEIADGCNKKVGKAILELSKGSYETVTLTLQGGYQKHNGDLIYVTKRGAITGKTFDRSIRMSPSASPIQDVVHLVDPGKIDSAKLVKAVRFVLKLPSIFPTNLALGAMMLLLPIRAVSSHWMRIETSICYEGRFGTHKTWLAKLNRAFFNRNLDHDPIRWNSSPSALYDLVALNNHAVMAIDDFLFSPGQQKNHSDMVGEVLQAVANGTAPAKKVNGLILKGPALLNSLIVSTANAIPLYCSDATYSRIIFLNIEAGDVPSDTLTKLQDKAARGDLVFVTSAFVQYLLARKAAWLKKHIKTKRQRYRKFGIDDFCLDKRRSDVFATFLVGLDLFLRFCEKVEAISKDKADLLFEDCMQTLGQLLSDQGKILGKQSFRDIIIDALQLGVKSEGLIITDKVGDRSRLFGYNVDEEYGWARNWVKPSINSSKLVGWYDDKTQILHVLSKFLVTNLLRFVPEHLRGLFSTNHDKFWIDAFANDLIYEEDGGQKHTRRRRFALSNNKTVHVYCIKIDMDDPHRPFTPEWKVTDGKD